jgi:hypothetical protein
LGKITTHNKFDLEIRTLGLNSEIKEAETSSIAYTYIHKVDGELHDKIVIALQMITALLFHL